MIIDQTKIDEILKMDEAKAKRELKKYAKRHNITLDAKKTLAEMEADLVSSAKIEHKESKTQELKVIRDAVYVRHQDIAFITESHDDVSMLQKVAEESTGGEFIGNLIKANLYNAAALVQKYTSVGFRDAHTSIYYIVDKDTCKTKMPAIKQAF